MRAAQEKERAEKRAKHGEDVVAKTNASLRTGLTLDAFDVNANLPVDFARRPSFADCPGLVAAYVGEERVRRITSCCDARMGSFGGQLGFDEYSFVGTTHVAEATLSALLDAATSLHDSVLFCPDGTDSIVLIDHYKVSGVPKDEGFSIVVQGAHLESKLADCFDNVVRLKGLRAR
jgi:hypothetical protein